MWAPRCRSHQSSMSALVNTGKAMRIKMPVTSMFQVKIGILNIVIPGARK